MLKNSKTLLIKIIRYVRVNWGSPFIGAFVLLLLFTVAFLSMGLFTLANDVAVYAYYVLTVGVFLQLIRFLKDQKKLGMPRRVNESN